LRPLFGRLWPQNLDSQIVDSLVFRSSDVGVTRHTTRRYRAPVSATVRATKFPCIEYVFYFVEGKAVMPYRLWYVYISVKSESKTLILESEK
jgi:hypothetical protein